LNDAWRSLCAVGERVERVEKVFKPPASLYWKGFERFSRVVKREMKELTIVEKDRMGLLADVSATLGKAGVNIQTIFVDVTRSKQAIIHVVLKQRVAVKATKALRKAGFKVMGSDILVLRLRNRPGELSKACRILSDNGINVTNAFSISRKGEEGIDAISTTDNAAARKLLNNYL
jgi:hypothetical protein